MVLCLVVTGPRRANNQYCNSKNARCQGPWQRALCVIYSPSRVRTYLSSRGRTRFITAAITKITTRFASQRVTENAVPKASVSNKNIGILRVDQAPIINVKVTGTLLVHFGHGKHRIRDRRQRHLTGYRAMDREPRLGPRTALLSLWAPRHPTVPATKTPAAIHPTFQQVAGRVHPQPGCQLGNTVITTGSAATRMKTGGNALDRCFCFSWAYHLPDNKGYNKGKT